MHVNYPRGPLGRLSLCACAIALALPASMLHAAQSQRIDGDSLQGSQLAGMSRIIDADLGTDWRVEASAATVHGTRTVKLQQLKNGVPILGSIATVEVANGDETIVSATGTFTRDVAALASPRPQLDAAAARGMLLGGMSLAGGAEITEGASDLFYHVGQDNIARLAWRVSVGIGGEHPSVPAGIVDASDGTVLERWDELMHASDVANGPGGNAKIGTVTYGVDKPLLRVTSNNGTCALQNESVITVNLRQTTNTGNRTPWSFVCPTNIGDGINGGYGPLNDAHHYGSAVFAMYRELTGQPPISTPLIAQVHYARNYDNASWNPASRTMQFGDGNTVFYPLVALDVIAHEVSHGYTTDNSNLIYNSNHSGGMNEAFSDMAGEAAKFYANGSNDFLVGAEITKTTPALRYMCEPRRDGRSIDHQRDFKPMENHFSSGVYNKAFCTLAKTEGWNALSAFEAFARANKLYWTANSTFNQGACGVVAAANDLGSSVDDVVDAFDAVGVRCN
ncbi:M4 family metallopeptidase [Pinirhizobacter soli]|uniref:M4 family metallopeptidase n=1 Tax=Pinirhizobacter soli TaxID=2786953 RepID=UPI00202A71E0|nr:M4 family metallopeptidase [Pinirhizobacter soli]